MTTKTVREQYPVLRRQVNGHRLVYLDSAATALKPQVVIDAVRRYYEDYTANVHRSVHTLGEEATGAYEAARDRVQAFIKAPHREDVVFTRGTTESLNLVAQGYAQYHLQADDEILVTPAEHHSNLVPWQQVAARTGARLSFVELTPDGAVTVDAVRRALTPRTRIVSMFQASNVLGTVNPIAEIAREAHRAGAIMVVDGAQSVPHMPVDVTELDADFLAFSGHKLGGPTGVGVLYGKPELLAETTPLLFGGEMIQQVEREWSTFKDAPDRFEGGTPNIAGVIGLGAAIEFLSDVGMDRIFAHDQELASVAFERLSHVRGLRAYGPASRRTSLVAFNVEGIHPHDVAQVLDAEGVAVRAGHHCCQILMGWLDEGSTVRASFYLYNEPDDIDALVHGLERTVRFFHGA
ncbi:MAG: aminotransferase class V-fold PLP-dependent enzyme [Clostridia bacterium]